MENMGEIQFITWGGNCDPVTWKNLTYQETLDEPLLFGRGYTMHEHLDVFGLINMNGRVYDPWTGRFLSPDPILQQPANSQNYNRYSYALNNPLKYTDPSGYSYKPDDWNSGATFNGTGRGGSSNGGGGVWGWNESSYYRNGRDGPDYSNSNLYSGVGDDYTYAGGGEYFNISTGEFVGYDEVFQNYITPHSTILPINTNLNSIETGQKNGVEGTWYTTSSWEPQQRIGNVGSKDFSVQTSGVVSASFVPFGVGSDGGEEFTEAINKALDYSILFPVDMYIAAFDFYKNYSDMRQANWKDSDKYFHAKANFQATHRGPGGEFFAERFSNLREIWDQRVKGYPFSDSQLDQRANLFGREQTNFFGPYEYREALEIYRPPLLPHKY